MTADQLTDAQLHKLMDSIAIAQGLREDVRVGSIASTACVVLTNLLDDVTDARIDSDLTPPF